jgi:hypothetical protein
MAAWVYQILRIGLLEVRIRANKGMHFTVRAVASLLGTAVLMSFLGSANGTKEHWQDLFNDYQPEEIRHILTVCPAGPPACQYTKIQDAIDAAPEDLGSPHPKPPITKVFVKSGTYEENLVIRKSIILEGVGRDEVVLQPSSKQGQERETGILLTRNVFGIVAEISGLHIRGSEKGNSASVMILGSFISTKLYQNRFEGFIYGVYIEGSLYSIIEENEFQALDSVTVCDFVQAHWTVSIRILKNTFTGTCAVAVSGTRLSMFGADSNKPGDRVLIKGNQGGELAITDSSAILIRENSAKRVLLKQVDGAVIEENVFRRNGIFDAIEVIDSPNVIIQRNILEDNAWNGISVSSGDTLLRSSVTILNNHVLRNRKFGIVAESIDLITHCNGNEVKDNKQGDYGVGISSSAQPSPALKQKCEGS